MKKTVRFLTFFSWLLCMIPLQIDAFGSPTLDHSITIFVHGTYPARKLLQKSFTRFLTYCPEGLSLAKDLPCHYHFHKMAQGCVDLDKKLYSMDHFYIFGWASEHVYDQARSQAAAELVLQLRNLVTQYYNQYHVVPKIRLIGFSHGGNVVLHTAHYLPCLVNDTPVDIEIWLFGTPVQNVNKHLVNSAHFSKVYSFYSKKDWLQRIDPQGLRDPKNNIKNFWSGRMFNVHDRCIQVELTVNGQSISHVYYRSIFKYFPKMQKLAEEKSQGISSACITVDLKK